MIARNCRFTNFQLYSYCGMLDNLIVGMSELLSIKPHTASIIEKPGVA